MKITDPLLASLKLKIQKNDYENAVKEIKDKIDENLLSLEDEISIAHCCLVTLSINITDSGHFDVTFAGSLFSLANTCCQSLSKSWNLVKMNFLNALYYICEQLVGANLIVEAAQLSHFAFAFPCPKVDIKTGNVLLALLRLFLRLPLASNNLWIVESVWKSFCQPISKDVKRANFTTIQKYFASFLAQCNSTSIENIRQVLTSTFHHLCALIATFEDGERILLDTCFVLVDGLYKLCTVDEHAKESCVRCLFLECFDVFEHNCERWSGDVDACRHFIRIATTSSADSDRLEAIQEANRVLTTLLESESSNINNIIYFATISLVKLRTWPSTECPFDGEMLFEFVELVSTVIVKLREIQAAESRDKKLRPSSKEYDRAQDIFIVGYSAILIVNVASSEKIDQFTLSKLFEPLEKSVDVCLEIVSKLRECKDSKKRLSVYKAAGLVLVNACSKYFTLKMSVEFKKLAFIAGQVLVQMIEDEPVELQLYVRKFGKMVCTFYRTEGLHTIALRSALEWACILPDSKQYFFDIYGTIKQQMFLKNHLQLVESNALELLHDNSAVSWFHRELEKTDSIRLLNLELEQFDTRGICNANFIRKAKIAVDNLVDEIGEKAKFYVAMGKVLTNNDAVESLEYANKFISAVDILIDNLKKKVKTNCKNRDLKASLGDLHYVKFRIRLLIMRCENETDVKLLKSMTKAPVSEPGMERDPRDGETIVPTHNTRLSIQTELLKELDKAMKHWRQAVDDGLVGMNLKHLKETAFVHRLYCNTKEEIEAWETLYAAAKLANQQEMFVYAYANLLGTTWIVKEEWRIEVENVMLPEADEESILLYRINYSSMRLEKEGKNNSDHLKWLDNVTKEDARKYGVWANYSLLIAQCRLKKVALSAHKYKEEEELRQNPLLMCLYAYNGLVHLIKDGQWNGLGKCCELQCQFFDLALFIARWKTDVDDFVEAKAYLIDAVDLVQKLNLPLRMCQFLLCSAHIDIAIAKHEDSNVKLNNAYDILCDPRAVDKRAKTTATLEMPSALVFSSQEDDFRGDRSRQDYFDAQTSPTRFPFQVKIKLPDFIRHANVCKCNACSNIEYLLLYCEVTVLFGVYCRLVGENARSRFEDFRKLYNAKKDHIRQHGDRYVRLFEELLAFNNLELAYDWAENGNFTEALLYCKEALVYAEAHDLTAQYKCVELEWCITKYTESKAITETIPIRTTARKGRSKRPQESSSRMKTPPGKVSQAVVNDNDEDEEKLSKRFAAVEVSPAVCRSRRELKFATPVVPPAIKVGRTQERTQMSTPPDIVLQTPSSVLIKRMQNRSRQASAALSIKLFEDSPVVPVVNAKNNGPVGSRMSNRTRSSVSKENESRLSSQRKIKTAEVKGSSSLPGEIPNRGRTNSKKK